MWSQEQGQLAWTSSARATDSWSPYNRSGRSRTGQARLRGTYQHQVLGFSNKSSIGNGKLSSRWELFRERLLYNLWWTLLFTNLPVILFTSLGLIPRSKIIGSKAILVDICNVLKLFTDLCSHKQNWGCHFHSNFATVEHYF